MVLIMQADIKRQHIEGPIITECLGNGDIGLRAVILAVRRGVEDIVFCDEVPSTWMQRAREE